MSILDCALEERRLQASRSLCEGQNALVLPIVLFKSHEILKCFCGNPNTLKVVLLLFYDFPNGFAFELRNLFVVPCV